MTFAAAYAILVGVMMAGQWTITLAKKQVAGPEAGPIVGRGRLEMLFHWTAELATAGALLAGGSGLLLESCWGREVYLVSIGMLIYTVINSPGFFAPQRQWPMVALFAVLLIVALVSITLVV